MAFSRRGVIARSVAWASTSLVAIGSGRTAVAESSKYSYDLRGRLVLVEYSDGRVVQYVYDDAGNRSQVVRTTGSTGFVATIQISGTGPVNLRHLADAAGYTGTRPATITFEVVNGATITGAAGQNSASPMLGGPGGVAIDTGLWPTGYYAIALTLVVKTGGKVYGGGGAGGTGSGYQGTIAGAGGAGGDALYCQVPIAVTVQAGGEIKAGGGGGGAGAGWDRSAAGDGPLSIDGGAGGGGFPNGEGGLAGTGDVPSLAGGVGTVSGGGSGSVGVYSGYSGYSSGAGGAGGGAGAGGVAGVTTTGTANSTWVRVTRALGGAAGYAIRKNGHTVPVTSSGTIVGTQA